MGGSQGSIGSMGSGGAAGSGKLDNSSSGGGLSESSKDAKKKKEQKESKEAKEAAKNAISHQKVASDLAVARRDFQSVNQSFQRYLRHLHARARFDFSQRTAAFLYAHKSYYQQGMTVYEFFGEDLLAVMTEMEEARKEFEANPNLEEALVGSNANRTGAQRMSMFLALDGGDKTVNHNQTMAAAAQDNTALPSINKQGYMYKQSHKKVGKGWSMRWFMLEESSLSWYSNWKDTQPSGTLRLNLCRIKPLLDKPLCMEVLQASPEVRIILRTLTEKDYASWHSSLLQAVAFALSQDIPVAISDSSAGGDGTTGSTSSSLLLPPFVSKRIPLDTHDVLIQIQAAAGIISLKDEGGEVKEIADGSHSREPSSPREPSSEAQQSHHRRRSSEGKSSKLHTPGASSLAPPTAATTAVTLESDSASKEQVCDDGDDEQDTEEDRKKKKQRKKRSGKFASSSSTGAVGGSMRDSSSSVGKDSSVTKASGGPSTPIPHSTHPAVNPQLSQALLLNWLRRMHPSNQYCADCAAPNPDWCSINTGAILCIDCSGVHRSLGSHISKVRSLNMDSLKPAVQRFLLDVGNHTVNAIFEAKLGKFSTKPEAEEPAHSPQKSNTTDTSETPVIIEEDEAAAASDSESSSLSFEALDSNSSPPAAAVRPRSATTVTTTSPSGNSENAGTATGEPTSARSNQSSTTPPSSPRLSARGLINRKASPETNATGSATGTTTALGRVQDLSKKEKNASLTKPTPSSDRATRTKFIYAKYVDLKFVKKKGSKTQQLVALEPQHIAFMFPDTATNAHIHLNPSMTLLEEPTSHRLLRDLMYRDMVHEKLDPNSNGFDITLPSRTRRLNRALLRLVYEWSLNVKHEREGRNWVHEAAAANSPACVSFFALQGSPPGVATSQQDGQSYAVHFAAISGSIECIQLVASTPNECAAKDGKGRTPLDTLLRVNDNGDLKVSSDAPVVVNDEHKRLKKMNSKRMSKMMAEQQAFLASEELASQKASLGASGGSTSSADPSSGAASTAPLTDAQLDVVDYLTMILLPPMSTTPDLSRKDTNATLSPSSSTGSAPSSNARPARPGPSLTSAKVEEVRKRSWTLSGRTAKEASRMQMMSGDSTNALLSWDTRSNSNANLQANAINATANGTGPVIIGGASGDSTVAVPTAAGAQAPSPSPSASSPPPNASANAAAASLAPAAALDISRPFGTEQPKFMSLRLKQKHSQHGPLSSIFGASTGTTPGGSTSPLSSSTSSVAPPPPSLPSSPITLSSSQNLTRGSVNSLSLSSLPSHNNTGATPNHGSNGGSLSPLLARALSPGRIKMLDDSETVADDADFNLGGDGAESSDEELQNALRSGELMLDALISSSPAPANTTTNSTATEAQGDQEVSHPENAESKPQTTPTISTTEVHAETPRVNDSSEHVEGQKEQTLPSIDLSQAQQPPPKEKRGSGIFSRSKKDGKDTKAEEKKSKKSKKKASSGDIDESPPASPTAPSENTTEESHEDTPTATTAADGSAEAKDTKSSSADPIPDAAAEKDDGKKKDKKKDKESKDKDGEKKKIRPWALLRSFSVRETKKEKPEPSVSVAAPAESSDSVRASRSFWKNMDRKNSEEQLEKKKLSPSPSASSVSSTAPGSKSSTAEIDKTGDSSADANAPVAQKKRGLQRSTTMATPSGSGDSLGVPSQGGAQTSPRKKKARSAVAPSSTTEHGETTTKSSSGEVTGVPENSTSSGTQETPESGSENSGRVSNPDDITAVGSNSGAGASAPFFSTSSPAVTKKSDRQRFTRANKTPVSASPSPSPTPETPNE